MFYVSGITASDCELVAGERRRHHHHQPPQRERPGDRSLPREKVYRVGSVNPVSSLRIVYAQMIRKNSTTIQQT